FHLEHGGAATLELVDKGGSDRGGGPVRWDGGRVITAEFPFPIGFHPANVPVFHTNTLLDDAPAPTPLALAWASKEVEKKSGDARAIQFERIVGEITSALEPRFLRVPRAGKESRFLPVKDVAELERRRSEIELIARDRGMIPTEAAR